MEAGEEMRLCSRRADDDGGTEITWLEVFVLFVEVRGVPGYAFTYCHVYITV